MTEAQLQNLISQPSDEEILIAYMHAVEIKNILNVNPGQLSINSSNCRPCSAGLCVHPQWNYHAFQEVSVATRFLTSLISWKTCNICQERINGGKIIYCVSCQVYAHRSCGFRKKYDNKPYNKQQVLRGINSRTQQNSSVDPQTICPVNGPVMENMKSRIIYSSSGCEIKFNDEELDFQNVCFEHSKKDEGNGTLSDKDDIVQVVKDGPKSNSDSISIHSESFSSTTNEPAHVVMASEGEADPMSSDSFVSIWSFSSIMQNLFTSPAGTPKEMASKEGNDTPVLNEKEIVEIRTCDETNVKDPVSDTKKGGDCPTQDEFAEEDGALVELQHDNVIPPYEQSSPGRSNFLSRSFANVFDSTTTAADTASKTKKVSVGMASVTGQIVGGAAGLALAGPAGAFIGSKIGQAACILTVLIQGRRVILIGASALAAGLTIQKTISQGRLNGQDFHLLPLNTTSNILSGDGKNNNNVMLVRPNIQIDPEWESIAERTTKEFFKSEKFTETADLDIATATEVDTREKVLLLVARNLNDKHSFAGFMYRSMLEEHRKRSQDIDAAPTQMPSTCTTHNDTEAQQIVDTENVTDGSENIISSRLVQKNAKTDAHAVVIKITEALLSTQRSLSSSQDLKEMATDAVEILVLGELYHAVFDAIVTETRERDEALENKIKNIATETYDVDIFLGVSSEAVEVLQTLCSSFSAVEKLECFVTFLELISDICSDPVNNGGGPLDADSLLEKVCLHIVVARVPNIHAHVMFAEEFAKDEQLLRGKLGYALVTMQASLHILASSSSIREFVD